MQPHPAKFSARAIKASWWLGTASLAFGLFIKITSELLEHEVSGVDRTILLGFAKGRTPWLTMVAVDLTALGSVTLVVLISAIAFQAVSSRGRSQTCSMISRWPSHPNPDRTEWDHLRMADAVLAEAQHQSVARPAEQRGESWK